MRRPSQTRTTYTAESAESDLTLHSQRPRRQPSSQATTASTNRPQREVGGGTLRSQRPLRQPPSQARTTYTAKTAESDLTLHSQRPLRQPSSQTRTACTARPQRAQRGLTLRSQR